MHIVAIILSTLALLVPTIFSHPTINPSPPATLNISRLLNRDNPNAHPFCVPPQGFTIGYQQCTFASAILSQSLNPTDNGTLANAWIFDALCKVIGVAQNIQTSALDSGIYDFDSTLQYVTATDFGDGRLGSGAPKVTYAGKYWQPSPDQACWWMDQDDVGSIWGCVFQFDCY
ncbi:hypothetical protein EG329_003663 [Mollisiaceae sp. DMI_Dod_QoI]|nr:hypothetical protein EG329_003663 [Helotiales sp. DMI_Dod_QoI]